MTHEEKIGLLTGEYIQIVQYTLYSAIKVACLYMQSKNNDNYRHGSEEVELALAQANQLLREFQSKSTAEKLQFLCDKGLSVKEYTACKRMLEKRDYILSLFFIDHSKDFASQDVRAYDDIIDELNKLCDEVSSLNQSLSRTMNKLIDEFSKF